MMTTLECSPVATSFHYPNDLRHVLEERGDEEGLIIQRDQLLLARAISKEMSKKGVLFSSLHSAQQTSPALVETYARSLLTKDPAWKDGVFVYVPAYVSVVLPLHVCFWLGPEKATLVPRTIVVAEKGSQVALIHRSLSVDKKTPAAVSSFVEMWAAEKADVTYVHLENWGDQVTSETTQKSRVAAGARLRSFWVCAGKGASRDRQQIEAQATPECVSVRRLNILEADAASHGFDVEIPAAKGAFQSDVWTGDVRLGDSKIDWPMIKGTFLKDMFNVSLKEKVEGYLDEKWTGVPFERTLHRVSELHPEVRH